MWETTESKSFLQTLHSTRIILGIELVEVRYDSLNVRGTVLGHVFTDRREVAVIVAAQEDQTCNKVAYEANTHVIASTTLDVA
jgi:hypothetical protein